MIRAAVPILAALALAATLRAPVALGAPCEVIPLSHQEVIDLASSFDDWNPETVDIVAGRESTLCPTAVNGRYKGLTQIDEAYAWQLGLDGSDLLDAPTNIYVMHYVYVRWGRTFQAWGM